MNEQDETSRISIVKRKKREGLPTYVRIAHDIALRIANGDIKEGKKLSGRSIMSSEYGVSPETIRRSFSLLEEMQVVSVHQNSGVIVLSSQKANQYVERHITRDTRRELLKRMHKIYEMQREAYDELMDLTNTLVDSTEHFIASSPFYTFEATVPPYSFTIDKSLRDLDFWQKTKATVIAIKREGKVIISPGPHEKFLAYDILVMVGKPSTKEDVNRLLTSSTKLENV